jgi:predicted 2-oxoglutarate/Fe(II)-dependent dioxygenase YbiX
MTKEDKELLYNFAVNLENWHKDESVYDKDGVMIYDASFWANRVANQKEIAQQDSANIVRDKIVELLARFKEKVDAHLNVNAVPTFPAFVRWFPGNYQLPHADKELHEGENSGKPNNFPYYDIAGLMYLNDDYEGGELYFPQHDIEFKPKAGAAYFFPGDKNFIHGVKEVTAGVRYTLPFFWTIVGHGK